MGGRSGGATERIMCGRHVVSGSAKEERERVSEAVAVWRGRYE